MSFFRFDNNTFKSASKMISEINRFYLLYQEIVLVVNNKDGS